MVSSALFHQGWSAVCRLPRPCELSPRSEVSHRWPWTVNTNRPQPEVRLISVQPTVQALGRVSKAARQEGVD